MPKIMEVEARLVCPKCSGCPYVLYRRQREEGSDVYENVLWPAPDSHVGPPRDSHDLRCPECDEPLERKSK